VVLSALGLLILALARPRVPLGDLPDPSKGIDIMLALDFSSSMTLKDFHLEGRRVSRRDALTHVVEDFVRRRPNDRIGIVGFAKGPFLVSPLTLDHGWTLDALHQAATSTGTAIGEGLVAAVHFLLKASQRSKVAILVTDGENDLGRRPLDVLAYPQRAGVKVYAILIGPEVLRGGALLNHDLFKVSRATGGQFFQATDTRSLEGVYAMIDQLEKKALREKRLLQYRELFPWLAAAAFGLLLADAGTRTVHRRIP
jgi:Ca-activated chloride channel family protein